MAVCFTNVARLYFSPLFYQKKYPFMGSVFLSACVLMEN